MVEEKRDRRRVERTLTLGAAAILGLALVVMVNYLGGKYYKRFDWTSSRLYSLSEKSLNVVRSLDRDVEAVVLMTPADSLYEPVQELLSRYAAESPRFSTRSVEPEKNLVETRQLVERFGLSQLNVVVFDAGDDQRVVSGDDLAEMDFSGMQFGQGPEMTAFKGEEAFTGTLIDLMEETKLKVVFTTGHGERGLDDFSAQGLSQAEGLLRDENFEVEEWASLGQAEVPAGTNLLVVAGPTSSFVEPELAALKTYLDGGGRMLLFLDPPFAQSGGLVALGVEKLLLDYGVEVGTDVVVDPANPLPFFGAETIFVNSFGAHPITRSLEQTQVPVILPLARSVGKTEDIDGFEISVLLETSADGWGEVDLENLAQIEKSDADLAGPVPVAVAVAASSSGGDDEIADDPDGENDLDATQPDAAESTEPDIEAPTTRLVVIGDSDFVANSQLTNAGNLELFSNTVNWLAERSALVGIPPKRPEQVRLNLTGGQLRTLSWLVFGALPGLGVLLGTAVYFRRRR